MEIELKRNQFYSDKLRLSYLDAGGEGNPFVALHAHWMDGRTFQSLAAALFPEWRLIAPDQRGHGYSDHAADYSREGYLADLLALLDELAIDRCPMLGHSLGGVNVYHFAARYPERVTGMIIEDIGVVLQEDGAFIKRWGGIYETRRELEEKIGQRLAPYVAPSFRETAEGWRLAFEPADMIRSTAQINGDHWKTWLSSKCPALVVRGSQSRVSDATQLRDMAQRRPQTRFVEFDGGHAVHLDAAKAFEREVRQFLTGVQRDSDAELNAVSERR